MTTRASVETATEPMRRLDEADLVLLDLDGCLIFGETPHPAAARLLAALGERYLIVSNNSTETPDSMARLLQRLGLPVAPERILLAGALMVEELRNFGNDVPTALFAAPLLIRYAAERGVRLAGPGPGDRAGRVAIARHTTLSYESLNAALAMLAAGAPLIISNPDLTHPGPDRRPIIETGGLLALFQACLPGLRARIVGKPEPLMFETALRRFGVAAERAVMVGDNPLTDGLGARQAGMAAILVGPGGQYGSIADIVEGPARQCRSQP